MSTVPPTDSFDFSENSAQNQAALEELTSAIVFGQGADTITLLLVRCNYGRLRDQMVAQLRERLAVEDLQGPVQVLQLEAENHNLYARLRSQTKQLPGTVLVLGAEQLNSSALEAFLVDLNKRREEFRREFQFPLVLWFTDEGYRRLSQYANDFESIAGGETIEFALSTEALIQGLQLACDRLFNTLLAPNTPESFNQRLKQLDTDYLATDEVSLALADLQQRGVQLTPDLQAGVTFAQGLNVPNQDAAELFEQSAHHWQTQDPLKYGLALFYLGRARYYAVDSIKYQNADWKSVLPPLQEAVDVFEQAERPDLVCKGINQLERVLHRLQRWEQLETVAKKAVDLRQRYPNPNKQAENYGFLADIALQRGQWQQGAELSQLALDTLERQDSWWRMLYLARLAEANHQLGEREAAVAHLQTAQQMGVMEHPTLYSNILAQLQQRLREQEQYLEAFKVKQERLAVEKQYGLRAFIGAGRLRSQRIEQPGTVQTERASLEEIAPEITASGRYRDLKELLKRIAGTTHKVLVVHGTSGVGKSSLINGGLLPALRGRVLKNRRNVPVVVRKYTDWRQALARAMAPLNLPGGDFESNSLGRKEALNNRLLDVFRRCEEHTLRPVLLFDQFEEFFFANPDPLQRREFFEFVADCLELPGALKIVFSIREDYLHYLLEARQLVKQNQLGSMARAQLEDILGKQILYEIGNFSPADAKAIIENLASGARMYLEPGLVEALVDDLAGPLRQVRPIEMQVVGAQLQTDGIQTLAEYRQLAGQPKETLVRRYLDDVVVDCGEENRQLAELVLFLLTDERGTRPLKTRPELVRELEALGLVPETEELDLVLRILSGSGIVVYLPDTPDDRYQLVHDYLAGVIRAQQAPQLEQLVAELEEEKQKRLLLESEKADLEAANEAARGELILIQGEREDLQAQNRKARRGLAGTVAVAGLVAALTVSSAIAAGKRADRANKEAAEITQLEALAGVRELEANVDVGVAGLRQGLATSRANTAIKREQEAQKKVEEAQQQVAVSKQEQQIAQAAIESAQIELSAAQAASQQAAKDVEVARIAQENAFLKQEEAQKEAEVVQRITVLERTGTSASRSFPFQETEALFTAFKASKEANEIFKQEGQDYLAASPILALQTGLNNIRETRLTGHQGRVLQVAFSPTGDQLATSGADGTARLWDLNGNEIAQFEGHQG
ncbi:MAG: hypothetical protein AAF282_20970, partial [Cyanobacteria bacterium P01_A01_bin.15]